jgi:hypothetical protein
MLRRHELLGVTEGAWRAVRNGHPALDGLHGRVGDLVAGWARNGWPVMVRAASLRAAPPEVILGPAARRRERSGSNAHHARCVGWTRGGPQDRRTGQCISFCPSMMDSALGADSITRTVPADAIFGDNRANAVKAK